MQTHTPGRRARHIQWTESPGSSQNWSPPESTVKHILHEYS